MILLDAVEGIFVDPWKLLPQSAPHRLSEGRPSRANTEPDQAFPDTVEVGHLATRREPALDDHRLKSSPGWLLWVGTDLLTVAIECSAGRLLVTILIV